MNDAEGVNMARSDNGDEAGADAEHLFTDTLYEDKQTFFVNRNLECRRNFLYTYFLCMAMR